MKNAIVLNSGVINNGKSERLSVEIPSGMTGKQLMNWKAKNEAKIVDCLTVNELPCIIESSEVTEDAEGDSFVR